MLLVEFVGIEARLTSEFILALWLSFAAKRVPFFFNILTFCDVYITNL